MNRTLQILATAAILAGVASCAYKPEIKGVDTDFDISLTELKGTQVGITITPETDVCWYIFDVISVEEYDAAIRKLGSSNAFMQKNIADVYKDYRESKEAFEQNGDSYICDFDDLGLYFGKTELYYTGLVPETDYYAIGFCVDPINRVPSGPLQRRQFTTTAISPIPSNMELDFLIQDGEDFLYYYAKPTIDGKLCRDPYLVTIVADSVLENLHVDMMEYVKGWYADNVSLGRIDMYLKTDISRTACIIDKTPGAGYTIVAAPYNINNMDKFFTLHFVYTPGMVMTQYTRDGK